ncbi:MAG: LptF/LptG family permease [Myxococcaceae bacterium]
MKTLFRYVATSYLATFVGVLLAVMTVFLVTDFVDRAKAYSGPNWLIHVIELYGWKAILATQQLGPAAILLAAGVTVSAIRKRGELTALDALAFGPRSVYVPIGILAFVIAGALIAVDEFGVVAAGPKVDQIMVERFNRWGDWRFYYQPKQWYRRGDRIFYLKNGELAQGYEDVTILKLSPQFALSQRIDAKRMVHVEGTRWRLFDVADRTFDGQGQSRVEVNDVREYDLAAPSDAFRILKGRPEQMRLARIREQIEAREDVGLPMNQFMLALHNRFAYPLAAVPAALLAVGLALRRERKGHVTAAVVEGLVVTMTLWGVTVVCKTLVLSDRMSPILAAWMPALVLIVGAWLARPVGVARPGRRSA